MRGLRPGRRGAPTRSFRNPITSIRYNSIIIHRIHGADGMREKRSQQTFGETSRRGFLGGVGAVVAAAAYSGTVAADDAARVTNDADDPVQTVESPDGSIAVTVDAADGVPTYEVARDGSTHVGPSTLGFDFRNQPS